MAGGQLEEQARAVADQIDADLREAAGSDAPRYLAAATITVGRKLGALVDAVGGSGALPEKLRALQGALSTRGINASGDLSTMNDLEASVEIGWRPFLPVDVQLDWGDVVAARFPVLLGAPFARGWLKRHDVDRLVVLDDRGETVSTHVRVVNWWPDSDGSERSVRWVHVGFVAERARQYRIDLGSGPRVVQPEVVVIPSDSTGDAFVVETEGARYEFDQSAGLRTIALAGSGGRVVAEGGEGFYVVDGDGRRATFRPSSVSLLTADSGPAYVVVEVRGAYLTDDDVVSTGLVYYHFFAGSPACRVTHKLIETRDEDPFLTRAFREVGLSFTLPLDSAKSTGTFNVDHDDPTATQAVELSEGDTVMMQADYPHFASAASNFTLTAPAASPMLPLDGEACGDWFDVSDPAGGLSIQVPAFAEQFPKALRATITGPEVRAVVELWSSRAGAVLDLGTRRFISDYLGDDWITKPSLKRIDNNPAGSAKTHEVWLYPHRGPWDEQGLAEMGGSRHGLVARVDPRWSAASGVYGPIAAVGAEPSAVEALIDDYFTRKIFANQQVFPTNGYRYYGMHPYVSAKWPEPRNGPDGAPRWYPAQHRLARSTEYNLRRSVWLLWARGGHRRYLDYARRHTRLAGDLLFSHTSAHGKLPGWLVFGEWDSPIVWGAWNRAGDGTPRRDGDTSALVKAGASDVIHLVYDYLLTGDLHSRAVALRWKGAVLDEFRVANELELRIRTLDRPDSLLRMLSSIALLDNDSRVDELAEVCMSVIAGSSYTNALEPEIFDSDYEILPGAHYEKAADVFAAIYHYWVTSGDPLARRVLQRYAKFGLRFRAPETFFHRNNAALLLAGAVLAEEDGDGPWAARLRSELRKYGGATPYLAHLGLTLEDFHQASVTNWGQASPVDQIAHAVALPHAMGVIQRGFAPDTAIPPLTKSVPAERTYVVFDQLAPRSRLVFAVGGDHLSDLAPTLERLDPGPVPPGAVSIEGPYSPSAPASMASPWYQQYGHHQLVTVEVASTGPGQYRLDLGAGTTFRLIDCEAARVVIESPDGHFVQRGEILYFDVPPSLVNLRLFAHREVSLLDADGRPVETESYGDAAFPAGGLYSAPVGGRSGRWTLTTGQNPDRPDRGGVDTFVRLLDLPNVFAVDQGDGHFLPSEAKAPAKTRGNNLRLSGEAAATTHDGVTGQARFMFRTAVEHAVADFPFAAGSLEFHFKPNWSTTDFPIDQTSRSLVMFEVVSEHLGYPITNLTYRLRPDLQEGGYNRSALYFDFYPVVNGNVSGMWEGTRRFVRLRYPVRLFLDQERWYRISAEWNVPLPGQLPAGVPGLALRVDDEARSLYSLELGRAVMPIDSHYRVSPTGPAVLRYGSNHTEGRFAFGETYDRLRVWDAHDNVYVEVPAGGGWPEATIGGRPSTGSFVSM